MSSPTSRQAEQRGGCAPGEGAEPDSSRSVLRGSAGCGGWRRRAFPQVSSSRDFTAFGRSWAGCPLGPKFRRRGRVRSRPRERGLHGLGRRPVFHAWLQTGRCPSGASHRPEWPADQGVPQRVVSGLPGLAVLRSRQRQRVRRSGLLRAEKRDFRGWCHSREPLRLDLSVEANRMDDRDRIGQ